LWLKKVKNFISEIKREHIQVAVDLSLNSQFGFFSWAAGIKERIGYDYKKRGRFLTTKKGLEGYEDKHIVDYYLELLQFLEIEPKCKKIELFLNDASGSGALTFLEQNGIHEDDLRIIIVPCGGASWGKESFRKHWQKEKFAQLADSLIDRYKAKVIFAGSHQEASVIEDIEKLMFHKLIAAVDLPLADFLSLLNKAHMLITNDGGPLHMGVALGVKTVSLFGPVSELVYGPYSKEHQMHTVIKRDFSCRPCYRKFRMPECPYNRKCLNQISVDEVYRAVERTLSLNEYREEKTLL
ncbi:MAG: glycosyltransferase family 9 protein, partial [Candidatus Omnitrophota bacterium]